jgi:hypothetical protein
MVYPDSAARPAEVRPSVGFFFDANSIRFFSLLSSRGGCVVTQSARRLTQLKKTISRAATEAVLPQRGQMISS